MPRTGLWCPLSFGYCLYCHYIPLPIPSSINSVYHPHVPKGSPGTIAYCPLSHLYPPVTVSLPSPCPQGVPWYNPILSPVPTYTLQYKQCLYHWWPCPQGNPLMVNQRNTSEHALLILLAHPLYYGNKTWPSQGIIYINAALPFWLNKNSGTLSLISPTLNLPSKNECYGKIQDCFQEGVHHRQGECTTTYLPNIGTIFFKCMIKNDLQEVWCVPPAPTPWIPPECSLIWS